MDSVYGWPATRLFWGDASVHGCLSVLLQLLGGDLHGAATGDSRDGAAGALFSPAQPREKWIRKRTSVKIKNVTPNHRGNDVLVCEGVPQVLAARFTYGPIDMVSLTGEKVGRTH